MSGQTGIGWPIGLMSVPAPTTRHLNGYSANRADSLAHDLANGHAPVTTHHRSFAVPFTAPFSVHRHPTAPKPVVETHRFQTLSDAAVRNATPREKPYKIGDSGGLYLNVQPNGSKRWRHKYRHLGIEKKFSIRPYPEISLSEARRRRDTAGEQLYAGLDPSRETVNARQHAKAAAGCTFTFVAEECCAKRKPYGSCSAPRPSTSIATG